MSLHYLKDVVTLKFDPEMCNGCGRCVEVCPHGVFLIKDRRAMIGQRDDCMECGACARNCAPAAINVRAGVGCAAAVLASRGGKKPVACGCETECCN